MDYQDKIAFSLIYDRLDDSARAVIAHIFNKYEEKITFLTTSLEEHSSRVLFLPPLFS